MDVYRSGISPPPSCHATVDTLLGRRLPLLILSEETTIETLTSSQCVEKTLEFKDVDTVNDKHVTDSFFKMHVPCSETISPSAIDYSSFIYRVTEVTNF